MVDVLINKQETAIALDKLKVSLNCIFKVLQNFEYKPEINPSLHIGPMNLIWIASRDWKSISEWNVSA